LSNKPLAGRNTVTGRVAELAVSAGFLADGEHVEAPGAGGRFET